MIMNIIDTTSGSRMMLKDNIVNVYFDLSDVTKCHFLMLPGTNFYCVHFCNIL